MIIIDGRISKFIDIFKWCFVNLIIKFFFLNIKFVHVEHYLYFQYSYIRHQHYKLKFFTIFKVINFLNLVRYISQILCTKKNVTRLYYENFVLCTFKRYIMCYKFF